MTGSHGHVAARGGVRPFLEHLSALWTGPPTTNARLARAEEKEANVQAKESSSTESPSPGILSRSLSRSLSTSHSAWGTHGNTSLEAPR